MDPRLRRLAKEHELVRDMCKHSELISYEPINPRPGLPPENYRIGYSVRSIVGITESQEPIYGSYHVAELKLPSNYPMVSSPICYMRTPVWHPNIRFSGELKGHICINAQVLGHWHTLDMLIEQIGEMLQYKNYHALDILPYPEDRDAAKWVREYAEPRNIVNKAKNIAVDNRPLLKPSVEWQETRKQKIQVIVNAVRRNTSGTPSPVDDLPPEIFSPPRKKITVTKR